MVGEVDESANVVRGTGFTAALVSPGEYAVTFSTPFLAPPVVVAVAQQYAICYLPSQTLGLHEVRIKCMSDLLGDGTLCGQHALLFLRGAGRVSDACAAEAHERSWHAVCSTITVEGRRGTVPVVVQSRQRSPL